MSGCLGVCGGPVSGKANVPLAMCTVRGLGCTVCRAGHFSWCVVSDCAGLFIFVIEFLPSDAPVAG